MSQEGLDPNNPARVYTDGIFDCFHYGHAKVLEQCKKLFPYVYLVVGVCSDEDTIKEKGKPIMTVKERVECVKHCKWVDDVVENCPWACTPEFLDKINCKYIAHDPEPYPYNDVADVYGRFKEAGRFLATKRTEGISTTDIIYRILKDYEVYLERSVKKGAKMEDININKYKYMAIKIKLMWKSMEKRLNYNPLRYMAMKWKGRVLFLKKKEVV